MRNRFLFILRKNLLYLVSLILSFFLWFYVLNTEPLLIEKKINLTYLLPQGMGLTSDFIPTVTLKLKGPRVFIRDIEEKDYKVQVNVDRFLRGNKEGVINPINFKFHLPLGVKVLSSTPASIQVTLRKSIKKRIPIEINLVGHVGQYKRLVQSEINPSFVQVEAAKSVLKGLKKILTEQVLLEGLQGKGEQPLSLSGLDPRVRILGNEQVQFRYLIRPTTANLELNRIRIRFLSSRPIRKASHRYASVLVFSEKGEEVPLSREDVSLWVDIPEDKRGAVKVKLQANLPEGIHLLKIRPEVIDVTVR